MDYDEAIEEEQAGIVIRDKNMSNLVPVEEFKWGEVGKLRSLTCINHQEARYLTKNPWLRGLHFVKGHNPMAPWTECSCPFSDLVVIIKEENA